MKHVYPRYTIDCLYLHLKFLNDRIFSFSDTLSIVSDIEFFLFSSSTEQEGSSRRTCCGFLRFHPRERSICDVNREYRGTQHTRVLLSTWSVCLIVRLSILFNIFVHLETIFLKQRRYHCCRFWPISSAFIEQWRLSSRTYWHIVGTHGLLRFVPLWGLCRWYWHRTSILKDMFEV